MPKVDELIEKGVKTEEEQSFLASWMCRVKDVTGFVFNVVKDDFNADYERWGRHVDRHFSENDNQQQAETQEA